jgi:hypothetical protein
VKKTCVQRKTLTIAGLRAGRQASCYFRSLPDRKVSHCVI